MTTASATSGTNFLEMRLLVLGLALLIAALPRAKGAPLQAAHLSEVIQDVRLLTSNAASRPAAVNDEVRMGMAVRTAAESRAELTFTDLTVTRLGANTIFSMNGNAREVDVATGSILLEVRPKGAAVTIKSRAVAAAVQGGTALFGTGPPTKFMVLEGIGTFYPTGHPDEAVTLHGGEMVMLTADGHITQPEKFDVKSVVETSALIVDFPDLANLPLILQVIEQQQTTQLNPGASPPPTKDIVDIISQNVVSNPAVTQTPSPPPLPTPSESGTPSVISSPNPYVITNRTIIKTDTSITTHGRTDFGKIYHGPTQDGPFTLWAFGSTSAFDTALKIDAEFMADPNNLPVAVFKFQNLLITGNPTIDTTNGVTHLGLIGVDGITTGPPGGTLTFAGLDLLFLATVNGPINLTSDVSFQSLSTLAFYARGAGSDLTINSPISGIGDLKMAAENSIQLTNPGTMSVGQFDATAGNSFTAQIGGSLSLNGKVKVKTFVLPGATLASGANLQINTAGDFSNSSTGDLSTFQLTNQGTINQSANISLGVNGNLNCANAVLVEVDNELDSGVSATHGGTIGGDSSINVSASTVSTGGFLVDLLNENDQGGSGTAGGHIGGTASIAISVNGALTTNAGNPNVGIEPGIFELFIENYGFGDGSPGGFIGSNASVSIAAASISNAADFAVGIDNSDGGTIGGAARMSVTAGSMSVDEFSAAIYNGNFTGGEGSVGGHLVGAASITFNITGALNVAGGTDNDMDEPSAMAFVINNSGFGDGSPAGSIGSDASINVTAGSISDNGLALRFFIFNSGGGMIGGNASITVAANSISAAGPGPTGAGENLNLSIDNTGGTIGGNATINIGTTGNVNAGNLFAVIFNSGGSISGDADIALNIGGTATVTNNATIQIVGNDPGGTASIEFNGGSYQVGGRFFNTIDGDGTITFTNTDIHANTVKAGVFGANGSLIIGGSGSNTISADTLLKLYAPGSNGLLKFIANVTLSSGTAMDLAANTITINSGVTVTIAGNGGAANVYTNNANYSGFGGSNSSNGTFAGNGANSPQPLANAPTFGAASSSSASSGTPRVGNQISPSSNITSSSKATGSTINVGDSGQLLSLLDSSTAGTGGKITVSNTANRSRNSRATSPTDRSGSSGGAKNVQSSAGVQQFPATVAALPRTQ